MKYAKFILYIFLFGCMSVRGEVLDGLPLELGEEVGIESFYEDNLLQLDHVQDNNCFKFLKVKKKLKGRSVSLEKNGINSSFSSSVYYEGLYKACLNYGVSTLFLIQRHTHLHLYQLF